MKASGTDWNVGPKEVKALYAKLEIFKMPPEYAGTRGIPVELSGTIPKG